MFLGQRKMKMQRITLFIVIRVELSNNDSLVLTITDCSLVVLQWKWKKTVVLKAAKLFKVIQKLTQAAWSVPFRLFCHKFFIFC